MARRPRASGVAQPRRAGARSRPRTPRALCAREAEGRSEPGGVRGGAALERPPADASSTVSCSARRAERAWLRRAERAGEGREGGHRLSDVVQQQKSSRTRIRMSESSAREARAAGRAKRGRSRRVMRIRRTARPAGRPEVMAAGGGLPTLLISTCQGSTFRVLFARVRALTWISSGCA